MEKNKKYIIIVKLAILAILISIFSSRLIVFAADDIASGQYENITWVIDGTGKLTVSGSGNYSSTYTKGAPWYQYRTEIKSAVVNITTGSTDLSYMFYGCDNLVQVIFESTFDTSNVTNMEAMFYNCSSLENLDVSNFNTGNVTNMQYMFAGCKVLTELNLSNFNTSKVTNMSNMFDSSEAISSLDLSSFNTENVTNMRGMFNDCINLETLNISSFNTANVTDMSYMFEACSKIQNIDISIFDTSKVTNMYAMFSGCSNLDNLNVTGINTANVTDMSYLFEGCTNITNINTSAFNTSKVTNMYAMFSGCSNLSELEISGFNTEKVTNLSYFAYNCIALTQIDMSLFNASLVSNSTNILENDANLTLIKSPLNLNVDGILPSVRGNNWADQSNLTSIYTNLPTNKANSITLILQPITYIVTLNANGGTINSGNITNYTYGTGAALPSDVIKDGYTFAGWYDNSNYEGSVITNITETDDGNKTYYAKWDIIEYTITYNLDGGNANENPITYTVETDDFTLLEPTKEGYTFIGWIGSNGLIPNKTVAIAKGSIGNLDYTANWEVNVYTVTLNINGGTINGGNITAYTYGIGVTLPSNVIKDGYTFAGWYDNSSYVGNAVISVTTTDMGNKEYYAKWIADEYRITYYLNGGIENTNKDIYTVETDDFTLIEPTKDGYIFLGWTGSNGVTPSKIVTITKGSKGDLNYIANWKPITYKVRYNANSGIGTMTDQEFTYDEEKQLLQNTFIRDGWVFGGWTTSDNKIYADQENVKNLSLVDESIVELKAIWKIPPVFYITYNLDGGTDEKNPVAYNQFDVPIELEAPIKEGYTFIGWTGSNGEALETNVTIPVGTEGLLEYTAHWRANTYTIKYNSNGGLGSMSDTNHTYDVEKNLDQNTFTLSGYTFVGWSMQEGSSKIEYKDNDVILNVASNDGEVVNLYAVWELSKYTVTFMTDGEIIKTQKVLEGGTAIPPDINKIGYTLSWDKLLTNIIEDTIITAVWMPNTYVIRYDSNGGNGIMTDKTFTYDVSQKLDKNVYEKQGYEFIGWSKSSSDNQVIYTDEQEITNETFINGQVIVLYAVWDENLYLKSNVYYIGDTNTQTYEDGEQYMYKISPNTKLMDFKNNIITNGEITVYRETTNINDTTLVGTGMTLQVEKRDKIISIILVVTGDIDGSGKVSVTDLSMLNQNLTGGLELKDHRAKAADLDYNKKISLTDLSRLNQYLLGYINSL